MSARLKSSVLRREERGFGSISMGRLIISGMIGGLCFFAMRLVGLSAFMIPTGLIAFIAGLVLTNLKHGIPLYLHWLITLRARLLMDSVEHPQSWIGQATKLLEMNTEQLTLDSAKLLSASAVVEEDGTLDEWEIVPDSAQMVGFEVVTDTIQLEMRG
jgi:hypothetical protein